MKVSEEELSTFEGLRRLVAALRAPDGCPWDRIQTASSLRPYLLEEASEALAAIDSGNPQRLREELGDLLLEVLLQVQIAEEAGTFTLAQVVQGIASKLVRRHPHVFAGAVLATPQDVVARWEELKEGERAGQPALEGVPETLPALAYAQALQRRAARAGFVWESIEQVWQKLSEEIEELRQAQSPEEQREELGDVLFVLADLARWQEVDAEQALALTCRSFARRFRRLEALLAERGRQLSELSLEEKLAWWRETKEL